MSTGGRPGTRPARLWLVFRGLAAALAICLLVSAILEELSRASRLQVAWTLGGSREPLLLPLTSAERDSTALFAAIDDYVLREMRAVRAPGLAMAIVHGDRIVHRSAFGRADSHGRPVADSTPFILGSLSKSITALAVMTLAESGRLRIDDPVQRYLPWFRVRDAALSRQITIRHLLNHTSGIPKSTGLRLVAGARAATPRADERLLRSVRLHAAPGRAFEYSNANYWLLGLVVEQAAGEPYGDYVRQRIFEPLHMNRSVTSDSAALMDGIAQGYRVWFGFPIPETMPFYARELSAGYLVSTADDMGTYLVANLNGGRVGAVSVISTAGMAVIHTPPAGSPYAMGWLSDTVAGTPVLWHTGAVANYHGDALIIPGARWGVVLLTNVNNFLLERQLSDATKGVASLLLGYEPPHRSWLRYREIYWALTFAAFAWLVWRGYQIATIGRWRRARRGKSNTGRFQPPHPAFALLDPGISLGLFFGVPAFLGSPLSTLRWFVPDMAWWLIVNTLVAVVIGAARLILFVRFIPAAERRGAPAPRRSDQHIPSN